MNLLLLSSSKVADTQYLEHAQDAIKQHLTHSVKSVLFIPYAGVSIEFNQYESLVAQAFKQFGYSIESIHHTKDPIAAIKKAEAIAVGGGNTFSLLNRLYENRLIAAIQNRLQQNIPYIGWSAGTNITAPTICTTNDMPIIEPPSFQALNLLPFQINPHYLEGNPPGHNGETREQRINEYLAINTDKLVIGIPEGTVLSLHNKKLTFQGIKQAAIFSSTNNQINKQLINPGSDLSYLLR